MIRRERRRHVAFQSGAGPGGWTPVEADRFDLAQQTLRALVAACSARIAASDPHEIERWQADRSRYTAELRLLDATDGAALERIITEYPMLLRQIRGGD